MRFGQLDCKDSKTPVRLPSIHGNLTQDPKSSIERKITILGKRIQVQHLIIAGTTAAITIGSLLLGEKENEDASWSH